MATLAQSLAGSKKGQWIVIGGGVCLVWAAVATLRLHQHNATLDPALESIEHMTATQSAAQTTAKESYVVSLMSADKSVAAGSVLGPRAEAVVPRKVIRTSSLELVVGHPAETLDTIAALVEGVGGYVETSNGSGQNASSATLTVRVPADRFEQAKKAIRKLALHVESERVDAQDVTRQYVDQDARLRNLRGRRSAISDDTQAGDHRERHVGGQ